MRKSPIHLLLALLGVVTVSQAQAVMMVPVVAIDPFEQQVLQLVNAERAAVGLSSLQFDIRLQSAAEAHSIDMATNNCFSHNSCDGTNWATRVYSYYPMAGIGENIAAGYTTAASVVNGWMNSPGHKANILDASYKSIGIGYYALAGSTYGTYWTQDFGTLSALPVPEPENYAMLLLGLGMIGAVAKRRRQA